MGEKKRKEWKLKDDSSKLQQKNKINRGGWKQISKNVLEAAKEVCVTTGHQRTQRGTWWWN